VNLRYIVVVKKRVLMLWRSKDILDCGEGSDSTCASIYADGSRLG